MKLFIDVMAQVSVLSWNWYENIEQYEGKFKNGLDWIKSILWR